MFDSAIEQMSATGFDMVIFSFGSGFQLESTDPKYIAQVKKNVAKAKASGIEVGAYGNPNDPIGAVHTFIPSVIVRSILNPD